MLGIVASIALGAPALADGLTSEGARQELIDTSIQLDLGAALAQESQPTDKPADAKSTEKTEQSGRALGYGHAGSRWWTIGAAYANNFQSDSDFNLHIAFSTFLADDLEFAIEGAGWYFHQKGDDTGGLSGSMAFRWHFLHADDYNWSVFGDAGIGMLVGFDEVPDGGTGFNFLPRVGAGFTKALNDSIDGESRGARLMVGVRYHHISNGRISGDSRNPARDAVCVYAAITFPF
jgi:hypothetical protein